MSPIKQYYDPVIVDIIRLVAFYSVVYLAILLANIHFIRQTKKKVFLTAKNLFHFSSTSQTRCIPKYPSL